MLKINSAPTFRGQLIVKSKNYNGKVYIDTDDINKIKNWKKKGSSPHYAKWGEIKRNEIYIYKRNNNRGNKDSIIYWR